MAQERRAGRALLTTVERSLARAHLLAPGAHLVVGVSGGPDSMCLLHLMATLATKHQLTLTVAHLNHGLRGDESDADARFVEEQCASLGIECVSTVRSIDDYKWLHPHTSSTEDAARQVRYEFFADVVLVTGAQAVVVGHTADDQVETVLLHLLRGAGLTGLSGMQPDTVRQDNDLRILRPLLTIKHSQTVRFCYDNAIPYRHDASNESTVYTRNRLRLEVLPLLREINPDVDGAVLRLASVLHDEDTAMQTYVDLVWPTIAHVEPDSVALNLSRLRVLTSAMQQRLVQRAYSTVAGTQSDLLYRHVQAALGLMDAGPDKRVSLSRWVQVSTTYDSLRFEQRYVTPKTPPPDWPPTELSVPGETVWGTWRIRCEIIEGNDRPEKKEQWRAFLDYEAVGDTLLVRIRRFGDRMSQVGGPGSQKLQDILVNAKVPRDFRDTLPIIESNGEIVWAPGLRVSGGAAVTENTLSMLRIDVLPEPVPE